MQARFGDWSVACGVTWTMPGDAREVRQQKKKRKALPECRNDSYFLMSSSTGQRWLGFHAPLPGKVYAAALLVAMVKQNAVVYQPLDDEQAWVCVIQDGMPAVGYDQVLPIDEARAQATAWSSMFTQAEPIGDLIGATCRLDNVLGVLDEALQSKVIRKKQIAGALMNVSGLSRFRIMLLIGVFGAACAAAYGVTWYAQIRESQKAAQLSFQAAARRAIATDAQKARLDEERRNALVAFEGRLADARAAQLQRVAPRAFWSAVSQVRLAVPLSRYGFKPQSFDCTDEVCRVTWLGVGRMVNPADKLKLPSVERNYSSSLDASSVFPLAPHREQMPEHHAASVEELQFLISSNFSLHLKAFTVDAPRPRLVDGDLPDGMKPIVVAEVGKWRAQIQSATALLDAAAVLDLMSRWPMRVTGIKYQPGTSSVELQGEFVHVPKQESQT